MHDYREVAKTLRECVRSYTSRGSKYIEHLELAAALCDRFASHVSLTAPEDPERVYCQQLLQDLQASPTNAVERLMQARASARAEGEENGIAAMRDANHAAHERYMQALADLQTKHDGLAVELQQLRVSEPPTSIFQSVRRWIGCTNPQHALEGDVNCPECVWR